MKQVTYKSSESREVTLTVAKRNDDGTLDLAKEDGTIVVTNCPVATEPTVGHACPVAIEVKVEAVKDSKPATRKSNS